MESSQIHREVADLCQSSYPEPDLHHLTSMAAELSLREKHRLSWERPYGVSAGLQNLGNTCYLNSALQCLTHTPPLANAMLTHLHSRSCRHQGFCMMCALEGHVTRSLLHSGDVIRPSGALIATFHRSKQEDAHEFLMFTLNAMQNSCLEAENYSDPNSEYSTIIHEIFGGHWRSQVRCLHCHGTSDTYEPYLDISLDITAAHSVSQALDDLVKPEELQGENAYQCNTCMKKVPATKTLTLKTVSKVLIIVMKRFSFLTGDKVDQHVKYPELLDMAPYMSQPSRRPLVYVLYAVLVHAGLSCHSGHYFSYVKAGDGQWYRMDDAKVTRCDITSVLNQRAYVLFYVLQKNLKDSIVDVHVDRDPGAQKTEDKFVVNQQSKLIRDFPMKPPKSQEPLESAAKKEMSLDQWKYLQERNRPKPELNLRRIEVTLPSNVTIIHQSKYGGHLEKNHSEKENSLVKTCARLECGQEINGQCPGQGRRPQANKKKNKQGRRPLLL